jgi:hypothetical protein
MAVISMYLRLSTAHVPEHLINQKGGLDAIDGVIAWAYEYGSWLWVPDNVDEHLDASGYAPAPDATQTRATHRDEPEVRPRSIPEIEALWRHARAHACDYIRLDADEEVDPDLPVYEWPGGERDQQNQTAD